MPDHLHDDDDEALASALADAWVQRAESDPRLRREALRAAGLLPQPQTLRDLASQCGISPGATHHICRQFRARLAAAILQDPACPPRLARLAAKLLP
jgi:hypothetical protein